MAKLQAEGDCRAYGDGTIAGLLASMDAAGIEVSVVSAIATKPDQAQGILNWCGKIRSDRLIPFPSVHPDDPAAAPGIVRIAEAGFTGIKLHPMYQNCAADDPRMEPIYATAVAQGLIVVSHCGRDIAYPPDDDRAAPERFARVLERFPTLKLLATHLGGWRMWDEVEKHLLGRKVSLETSFSLEELGRQRAAEMIRRHGVDAVLFGSDWPWEDQTEQVALVRGLGLTEAEQAALLATNAARLLGR